MANRLPIPGQDAGQWGDILNGFLLQAHYTDGSLKPISQSGISNLTTDLSAINNSVSAAQTTAQQALTTAQQAASATIADGAVSKQKLSTSVQTSLDKADSAYVKPPAGIPTTDLTTSVQTSLSLADTALQAAPVSSVAGKTGVVTLTKADVGLSNIDNTADANKPVSVATQSALNAKANTTDVYTKSQADTLLGAKANSSSLASVATSGDYADLTNKPSIPAAQVNADWNATSGVAQILNKPTIPTIPVTSVNTKTGDVVLTASDVGAATAAQGALADSAVQKASGLNRLYARNSSGVETTIGFGETASTGTIPFRGATSGTFSVAAPTDGTHVATKNYVDTALTAKADSSALATVATSGSYNDLTNKPTIPTAAVNSVAGRTGDVTLAKADVGLGNVDNTSDVNKPVSTAVQTALSSKVSTVSGQWKLYATDTSGAQITLGYTSDAVEWTVAQRGTGGILSVGTPTAAAHATTKAYVDSANALKAPLASPTFTGTVTVPTPTNGTDAATKAYVDTAISGSSGGGTSTALTIAYAIALG